MKSEGWGRGGGAAWAAGGKLHPRSELQKFVAEIHLMQEWRQSCLHILVFPQHQQRLLSSTGASDPACMLVFASSVMPVLHGAGNSSRSSRAWDSSRSQSLPGCRYPTNKEQAPCSAGSPTAPALPAPALRCAGGWLGSLLRAVHPASF